MLKVNARAHTSHDMKRNDKKKQRNDCETLIQCMKEMLTYYSAYNINIAKKKRIL